MNRLALALALTLVFVLLTYGCNQESHADAVSYEGHSLGETPMLWGLEENVGAVDPLQACREIVKSGVNPQSEEYKNCQKFVLSGDYTIKVRDWKSNRQRQFRFVGWKLATIVTENSSEPSGARDELTKRYGPPVQEDLWHGRDGAEIHLYVILDRGNESRNSITVISAPKS